MTQAQRPYGDITNKYLNRRSDMFDHRKRFWSALQEATDAAGIRRLQAAVTDWYFDVYELLHYQSESSNPPPGLAGLWSDVHLAGDVTGLKEVREVFLHRELELLPAAFLRGIGVALNNAAIIVFGLPTTAGAAQGGE